MPDLDTLKHSPLASSTELPLSPGAPAGNPAEVATRSAGETGDSLNADLRGLDALQTETRTSLPWWRRALESALPPIVLVVLLIAGCDHPALHTRAQVRYREGAGTRG